MIDSIHVTKSLVVRKADPELDEALRQEFEAAMSGVYAAIQHEVVCKWEMGNHLSDIQRKALWRADERWRDVAEDVPRNFETWVERCCVFEDGSTWSLRAVYAAIRLAREFKLKALRESPHLEQSHLTAIIVETAALPEAEREGARKKAIAALSDGKAGKPTTAKARKAAREAAGKPERKAPEARLSAATIVLSGEYYGDVEAVYLDPYRGNKPVKRPEKDKQGRPILAGLRVHARLRPKGDGDPVLIEIDLHRAPKARLGDA